MPVSNSLSGYRLTTPATSRTICIGSAYCRRNARHRGSAFAVVELVRAEPLRPRAASAELRPAARSTASACSTSVGAQHVPGGRSAVAGPAERQCGTIVVVADTASWLP